MKITLNIENTVNAFIGAIVGGLILHYVFKMDTPTCVTAGAIAVMVAFIWDILHIS